MTERKEPGQLAFEACPQLYEWSQLSPRLKREFAMIEAAIYEDAAKVADRFSPAISAGEPYDEGGAATAELIASAIRAKIGGSHG